MRQRQAERERVSDGAGRGGSRRRRRRVALAAARGARQRDATCCARGHTLHNLCRDSAGIDYALTTFETRLAAAHASQRAHLLLVDTAPNDFNTYWLASKRLVRRIGDKVHNSTQLQTDAFVRRVLSLSDALPSQRSNLAP